MAALPRTRPETTASQLHHWVKCYKDAAGNVTPADKGEYPFAKYNKRAKVLKYSDEEWTALVAQYRMDTGGN